ncbi:MAG: hypothetical protein Kow0077_25660 [Anaerolineae bacterium]
MTTDNSGSLPYRYWVYQHGQAEVQDGGVIQEAVVSVYVNGQELATVMCSPLDEEALALGFLYNEGLIDSLDDVGLVQANVSRAVVDVVLRRGDFRPSRRMILTAGCGIGVTFQQITTDYPALETPFATTPQVILDRMRDLNSNARLYRLVRGVHTAVLANTERVLLTAEDVGRHNTIDKIAGKALLAGIDPRDHLLLTSGRISSEMLMKARRMSIPIVGSRTAPTSTSVRLAKAWNICIVGYIRQGSLRVYTAPERLGLPPLEDGVVGMLQEKASGG